MATYQSTALIGKVPGTRAGELRAAEFEVSCSAAPSTSDSIQFGYLPAGATVVTAILEASDMDTNVSPTLTLNVGDADDADRLFAASTVGQTGAASSAIATAGAGHSYSSKTLITGVAAANAATGAAGTIRLAILYTLD